MGVGLGAGTFLSVPEGVVPFPLPPTPFSGCASQGFSTPLPEEPAGIFLTQNLVGFWTEGHEVCHSHNWTPTFSLGHQPALRSSSPPGLLLKCSPQPMLSPLHSRCGCGSLGSPVSGQGLPHTLSSLVSPRKGTEFQLLLFSPVRTRVMAA